jgi:hypothetical protein
MRWTSSPEFGVRQVPSRLSNIVIGCRHFLWWICL